MRAKSRLFILVMSNVDDAGFFAVAFQGAGSGCFRLLFPYPFSVDLMQHRQHEGFPILYTLPQSQTSCKRT